MNTWIFSTIFTLLRSRQSRAGDALAGFRSALAFLTRIPCALAQMELPGALPWFGAVGAAIGLCATGITVFIGFVIPESIMAVRAIAMGWLYVGAEMWLTRGLHWDGVADMGDALGSGVQGENFWRVLKDSRMGAFGAMALLSLMALQASLAALHWGNYEINGLAALAPLILAPAWGRLTALWLGFGSSSHSGGLGAMICGHVSERRWAFAWFQAVGILLFCLLCGASIWALMALLLAQISLNKYFRRLGHLRGGISGDFFGCLIELSQTTFLMFSSCGGATLI